MSFVAWWLPSNSLHWLRLDDDVDEADLAYIAKSNISMLVESPLCGRLLTDFSFPMYEIFTPLDDTLCLSCGYISLHCRIYYKRMERMQLKDKGGCFIFSIFSQLYF